MFWSLKEVRRLYDSFRVLGKKDFGMLCKKKKINKALFIIPVCWPSSFEYAVTEAPTA